MNRFASGLLATAFLAGSAGLAFAADMPAANNAQATPPKHHAMHMAAKHQQQASGEADRMTSALNALEANGYGDFTNFHEDGQNFAATVTQNNQKFNVVVNPDTHQVTRQG